MERNARLRGFVFGAVVLTALVFSGPRLTWAQTPAAQARPNVLVIFGDDIGVSNVSAYSHGLVGYRTPSIDRIAKEGMMFTDYYAEQSCTAGRSAFITGIATLRTGLSKVGVLRVPKIFDLHADPYERADITSNTYYDWFLSNDYVAAAAVGVVSKYLESYKDFPPSQRPASFTIDQAMEKLKQGFSK